MKRYKLSKKSNVHKLRLIFQYGVFVNIFLPILSYSNVIFTCDYHMF